MFRPSFTLAGLCAGLLLSANVFALSLSDLTQSDASGGLKDALTQGAQIAVKQLGTPGGFSNNQDVRIELPGNLGKAAKKMRQFGMGAQVDQLETSMNQAAEAAVPLISPEMIIPLMRQIDLCLEIRYDDFSDVGDTTNPKYGLIWDLMPGLRFRANWA